MGNFNNNREGGSRFGGGGRPSFGGGSRGGRQTFGGKKNWGGDRNDRGDRADRGPVTMHKATCAECGKECEVPFRPMEGKPVYCNDCFSKKGGVRGNDSRGGDRFPKRDFAPRPTSYSSGKPRFENNGNGGGNEAVMKQFEAVNNKLERLISAVETLASQNSQKQKPKQEKAEPKKVSAPVAKKTVKKKTSKK